MTGIRPGRSVGRIAGRRGDGIIILMTIMDMGVIMD
jgi:hypothetical protein